MKEPQSCITKGNFSNPDVKINFLDFWGMLVLFIVVTCGND